MQREWVVSPEYRTAINAISNARRSRGISQSELARRLGKHRSFINKIELIERRLDIVEFVTIASALDIEPSELFRTVLAALADMARV